MELIVNPAELGTAFRKAKVDLYYSTNPSLFTIADYEENLGENLQRLRKKINGKSTTWVKDPDFLGIRAFVSRLCGRSLRKSIFGRIGIRGYIYRMTEGGLKYFSKLRNAQIRSDQK